MTRKITQSYLFVMCQDTSICLSYLLQLRVVYVKENKPQSLVQPKTVGLLLI